MNILFVCIGNICRSPIAEGILKHLAAKENLQWHIESAATQPYHIGEAPHQHSQLVCAQQNIDISTQRARKFTAVDFQKFDKIYAMANDVMDEIVHISGSSLNPHKLQLFLEELYPGQKRSVKDPWYGELDGYYEVFDQINNTCKIIIEKYKHSSR